jgi:uncharacterized membrane protein YeaQ/YmgE (transglycosylase-associated protein family)
MAPIHRTTTSGTMRAPHSDVHTGGEHGTNLVGDLRRAGRVGREHRHGHQRAPGLPLEHIVGILGAFIGGLVIDLLGFGGVNFGWNWRSFGVAVLGAILLLAITGWGRRRA